MRHWISLAAVMAVAACNTVPTTPVFGEWQGETPGRSQGATKTVDLILNAAPGAATGDYRITTTEHDPNVLSRQGTRRWGGAWTRGTVMVDGRPVTTITLRDPLPNDLGGYALAADGTLRVLDPNGRPDTTPAGALYTLMPVRQR